jgi:hypothetical protein
VQRSFVFRILGLCSAVPWEPVMGLMRTRMAVNGLSFCSLTP